MFEQPRNAMLPPTGPATLAIISADVRDLPGRASQANPTGACLCLVLSAGDGYATLRSDVPLDRQALLHQVAAAADCDPRDMSPDFLVGRKVAAVVNHFTGRSGFVKAGIGRWLPARAARV